MNGKDSYNIMKHIHFVGQFCSDDEEFTEQCIHTLKSFFAGIFCEQGSYPEECYKEEFLPVQKELEKITYNIRLEPHNQAYVSLDKDTVNLSLYTQFIFWELASFRNIANKLSKRDVMRPDEIAQSILAECNSDEPGKELKKLLDKWIKYECEVREGGIRLSWVPPFELFGSDNYNYAKNGLKLIFHHEMSHWHLSRIKDTEKQRLFGHAEEELREYLEKEKGDPRMAALKKLLARKKGVIKSWVEEIAADYLSCMAVLKGCSKAGEMKQVFIACGLYFALLKAEEYRIHPDKFWMNTHPPAMIREDISMRMIAKTYQYSIEEFFVFMGSAWILISMYFTIAFTKLTGGKTDVGILKNDGL
ncbi:hypothetical protein [Cuneatibacter caecimuris]|uniref:Uncharacterized protein n=1 Tax=Cuneatibacter caecimuris TaxID=1796618 RepID=A0A4Q7PMW4_9FIRM|nr:hypothetical protein [Cuneatibacter caecimuris]RZT02103.1 hypothetical protein EV209_0208 [Cuneatibacter caecimuris]